MLLPPSQMDTLRKCSKDEEAFNTLLGLFEEYHPLVAHNNLLRAEIDSLDDSIAVLDFTGTIVTVNETWRRFGTTNKYPDTSYGVGSNYLQVCDATVGEDAKDAKIVAAGLRTVLNGEEPRFSHEYKFITPTEQLWFSITVKPFVVAEQHYLLVAHSDMTQRKLLADALQQSEQNYRLLTRNLPASAVFLFDHNLRYILAEGPAIVQAGLSAKDYIGKRLRDVMPPEVYLRDEPILRAALAGRATTVEVPFAGFIFEAQTLPVRNETGEITGGMVITRDISERKKAQEAQIERERLENALQQQEALNALKSRMMGQISHEFRTPLSVIQTYSELLNHTGNISEEKRNNYYQRIHTAIVQLIKMLENISLVVRGERKQLKPEFSLLDLENLANETVNNLQNLEHIKGKIEVTVNGENQRMSLDEEMIQAMLSNLLSNAIKYSPNDFPIKLVIDFDSQYTVIHVVDQGIGISEEDQKHLFEPFFRGHNVENIRGVGLGMSIIKDIVELHSGQITVQSKVGEGTHVTVELPQAPPKSH